MPFGGGSYADRNARPSRRSPVSCVFSAFRRWVLCGRGATSTVTKRVEFSSSVPFGGGSYADWRRLRKGLVCPSRCLQCLSAVGPMRTTTKGGELKVTFTRSSVPFGGGSYADSLSPKPYPRFPGGSLQCLSAVGPMRTIIPGNRETFREVVFSAFRRWVLCGRLFGASDSLPCSHVFSAFRRWVLCGQPNTPQIPMTPTKSSVPFGGGSYADSGRLDPLADGAASVGKDRTCVLSWSEVCCAGSRWDRLGL